MELLRTVNNNNRSVKRPFKASSAESAFLLDEFLSLQHRVLLQHLKVVFLIRGVLVDHEEVGVEFGDNEAQIELADDLHLFEHVFTVGGGGGRMGHLNIRKFTSRYRLQ